MKPLSDVMERALIAVVDRARSDAEQGVDRRWHDQSAVKDAALDVQGIKDGTVMALERRGLIEADYSKWPHARLVRASDEGIALCDGMGD